MTKRYLLAAAAAMATTGVWALPTSFYAPRSILSEGKWVKIGVTETGVYEISYDQLRAMGFSDPSKVGVFGRGGQMMPQSFTDAQGNPLLTDDLQNTGALHINGRLYFYGLGVDSYSFSNDGALPTGGKFVNNEKNIYSRLGYYFLTDGMSSTEMPVATVPSGPAATVTEGVGLVYHEADLEHNNTSTGRLFWGERFNNNNPSRYTWNVNMPDVLPKQGVMDCIFYSTYTDASGNSIKDNWLRYGVSDASDAAQIVVKKFNTVNFRPQEPFYSNIEMGSDKTEVFVEGYVTSAGDANLDYWAISYPKGIPSLTVGGHRIAQDMIVFPSREVGDLLVATLPSPEGCVALDISNPARPLRLEIDEEGNVLIPATTTAPAMAVFDISKPQLQISGYTEGYYPLANQNLHALQGQPVDMAIICVPWLRDAAERLADLHRRLDNMHVVVADMNEVYNEFSGGIPDPMAYRSFVKMLYSASPSTMKNLLLMGPVLGDVRGMYVERDVDNALIGYQTTTQSIEKGSFNVNDFYGMMADYSTNLTTNPEQQQLQVGVAVLPFINTIEASNYIDKVERYYADADDQLYTVGRQMYVGGVGDNHTHDVQARELGMYSNTMVSDAYIINMLPVNAYGNQKAHDKMIEYLNQGIGLGLYIGHGAADRLGWELSFFNNTHVMRLKNPQLPFYLFAGCSLTNFDRGQRGMGEKIVVEAPYGAIASLCTSRDTWSGQNHMLIRQILTCLHRSYTRNSENKVVYTPLENVLTLGEVYANTKSISTYPNDQAYHLVGDPAIKIPMVVRSASLSETPETVIPVSGQKVRLKGKVTDTKGKTPDTEFEGRVLARLIRPELDLVSEDLVAKEDSTQSFKYRDTQVAQATGVISSGEFDIQLDIPASLADCVGKTAYIYLSGLDTSTRNGMGYVIPVIVGDPLTSGVEPVEDTVAPVIESLTFDAAARTLSVTVSDDTALDLSMGTMTPGTPPFKLTLDGKFDREASYAPLRTEDDSRRFTRTMPVGNLSYGAHTARVEVRDAAGNTASAHLDFTYSPSANTFVLMTTDEAVTDRAEFFFEGNAPATGRLVIESTSGREVFTAEVSSNGFSWDLVDNDGNKVTPGRYKAYVVETGTHQTKGHSNTIDLAVI